MKDLNESHIDRGNILNNNFAMGEIYTQTNFSGVMFESKYRFTKNKISE